MKDKLKAKLATQIHYSYKDKEDNFREMPQFLTEETEDILQWIKENTSEEARKLIISVENGDDVETVRKLSNYLEKLEEEIRAEDLYTTIVVGESLEPELFLLLLLTRKDVKQFILSLLGDIKSSKVLPIAIMLIDLLQYYEESSELVKDF